MEISTTWVQSYNCETTNYSKPIDVYSQSFPHRRKPRKDNVYEFIVKLNNKIKSLESLKDGWADNEDNKEFSKIFLKILKQNMLKLLTNLKENGKSIFFPIIAPMELNSIDIHWRNDKFQFLINILETEDGGNAQVFGRIYDSENLFKWQGSIEEISNAVSGWLISAM